jgi:hypothetical protein
VVKGSPQNLDKKLEVAIVNPIVKCFLLMR